MSKYLEEKCANLGIRLVYTYNKTTVLSVEINKEKPLLIADMLFKNCPDTVAQAIIGFFTDIRDKSTYEKTIKTFVEEYFRPYRPGNIKHFDLSYLVSNTKVKVDDHKAQAAPPSCDTKIKNNNSPDNPEIINYNTNLDIDKDDPKPKDINLKVKYNTDNYDVEFNSGSIDVNDPKLVEFSIYKINSRDSWGGEKQYSPNTSIKSLDDDELNLNIVVLPPVT